jgi:multimeric flavodoxin WrbA
MKKIILVNASPRKNGNCSRAMQIIQKNLKNAEVEIFNLQEKKVNPCLACGYCKRQDTAKCVQKDDMSNLLERLDSCDALVVASPIYFGNVNGPAKTFVDRIYPFFNPSKENMTCATKFGKKCAVIVTSGSMPPEATIKQAEAYNCFGIAGFTDSKVLAFNSEKSGMDGNIFDVEENAGKIIELAAWLSE